MSERALSLLLAGLLLAMAWLQYRLWATDGSVVQQQQLRQKISEQHEENERLQSRNRSLAREISEMKQGGLAGVEEYARRELGMIKPGETLYQVLE